MIAYNPKAWFTFIFRLHRSETLSVLGPLLWAVAAYSGLIAYLESTYFLDNDLRNHTQSVSAMYSLLGFTLSLLLVFRTNTAYDRWWEGRKQWGTLTNASRTLASHVAALPRLSRAESATIGDQLGTFAQALQYHLRNERHPRLGHAPLWDQATHQPLAVHQSLTQTLHGWVAQGKLTDSQLLLLQPEISALLDVCGACERIKTTPIPFSYSVFLKKFIFFYVMLFPVVYSTSMGYAVVPVTAFILYVLASIELIAEEIEDPFHGDPNDLPTAEMADKIEATVRGVLPQ
jgi:putative membrane protein